MFYGTLMKPFHNYLLYVQPLIASKQATFLYQGITTERYPLMVHTDRNVPALYNNKNLGQYVEGEVWEVSEQGIEALDIIEGISGGFYSTGKIDVTRKESSGSEVVIDNCYVYFKGSTPQPLSLSHPITIPSSSSSSSSSLLKEEQEILQWLWDKLKESRSDDEAEGEAMVIEDEEVINNLFLNRFTASLHEDYTINRLFPDALAKASNMDIEKVNALIERKNKEGIIGEGKTKRELQTIYADLWSELMEL